MRQLALAVFASATLVAVEPTPVIADLIVPSGKGLVEGWMQSPYGQVWNAPGLASMRAKFDVSRAEWAAQFGVDPFTVLSESEQFRMAMVGIGDDQPSLALVIRGDHADAWFAAIAKAQDGTPIKPPPGVDEAVSLGDSGTLLRSKMQITWLTEGAVEPSPIAIDRLAQINLRFFGPALAEALTGPDVHRAQPMSPADRELTQRMLTSRIDLGANLTATGLTVDGTVAPGPTWLALVNPAALDRLPASTLEIAAIGLDGKALWTDLVEPLIARSRTEGQDPEQALRETGIKLTAQQLVTGLSGTWALAVNPGMPMPVFTIMAPRSEAIDQLVEAVLTRNGASFPIDGTDAAIALPVPLPITLTIAGDVHGWVLTTDPAGASAQLGGSGWLVSKLGTVTKAHLGAGTCAVSVSDTAGQLRMFGGMLNLGLAAAKDLTPKERQAILSIPGQLAAKAAPGWWSVERRGPDLHLASEGLGIGVTSGATPVMAGMLLPAINLVRVNAKRANSGYNMRQIALVAQVYANDNDTEMPPDIAMLKDFSGGDLIDKIFRSPGDPKREDVYRYVRPVSDAPSSQPMLVEDPVVWNGRGANVVCMDCHVLWLERAEAAAVWAEANRLAATPAAAPAGKGVTWADWQAVQAQLAAAEQRVAKSRR